VKASKEVIKLIKHHEGVRNKPYQCPAKLWTVGVGHLIGDGKTLPPEWNRTFTNEEIDAILKRRPQAASSWEYLRCYLTCLLDNMNLTLLLVFASIWVLDAFSVQPSVKRCYVAIKKRLWSR
jgi:GH24 family phage-related lysozyme (muramidase)